jgi:hypothetical protein
MGTLDAAARKHVDQSRFGLPARDGEPAKYPMPDAAHAADAKARAAQQLRAGNLTHEQYAHIVAMANKILGPGHHA